MIRRLLFAIVVCFCFASTATYGAQSQTNIPLRVALDLVDGAHIIGVPRIKSVQVQTTYAKIDVPLEQIMSIEVEDDHEKASFTLMNGDKLKGVLNLKPLQLETVFGKVSVGVEHLKRIVILKGGSSNHLFLHYSFDKDENGKVVDKSGRGHHGRIMGNVPYEDAVKRKGIRTSNKNTYVVTKSDKISVNGWEAITVSAWVKHARFSSYGQIVTRGRNEGIGGGFTLTAGGTITGPVFAVRFANKKFASVRLKQFAKVGGWYHIVGVYDGRIVTYYVNGKVQGTADVPTEFLNAPLHDPENVELVIGKSASHPLWSDTHINGTIDEVMIFKRALAEHQIKQLYDSQK